MYENEEVCMVEAAKQMRVWQLIVIISVGVVDESRGRSKKVQLAKVCENISGCHTLDECADKADRITGDFLRKNKHIKDVYTSWYTQED